MKTNHRGTEAQRPHREKLRRILAVAIGSPLFYSSLCILCASVPLWFVFADESASSLFILETADRELATGPLLSLGEDWSIHLGGREEVRVPGRDVVALRRAGRAMPPLPARNFILFGNGDALPVSRVRYEDERLVLTPRAGATKELRVGSSHVAVVWFMAPDDERHTDKLRRDLASGQRTRDRVLLRNGDSLDGTLAGMSDQAVHLEIDKRKVEVQLAKIAAIAMNTELAAQRRPKGPYARIVLANGCRLSLASLVCDGATLSGKALWGSDVQVKTEDLVALTMLQGRAVYLSDLKPSKVEQTPYLDAVSPPVRDGSAKGRDLRVGGGTYDKGLGMHSACRMTYDLAAGYKRFEATVGLDDATGRDGRVRIQVLVDGKPKRLALEGDLTHRNGPLAVRVDVSGAKRLTLVADFGERGDVQADVNWVDARLIKN
jgi:hypothetical protein